MNDLNNNGRVLNFYDLIKEYEIQIPIIQRDYAQGRRSQKEVRDNFLNAIGHCLKNDSPIKLDFIYGSIVNNKFQPLDGQQRLTTLFLIHWYASIKNKDKIEKKAIEQNLQKFTYETRISSREFCKALVNKSIDEIQKHEVLSDKIIDKNWFYLTWKNDPTIEAMLRTIDAIHEKFFEISGLWNKLNSNLIQFYFVELENMGLTDDLYIKMNARGKLLTPFENFKAAFQKKILDENWEEGVELKNQFIVKIDNDWTDSFWDHFRKNNTIDEALIRYTSAIAMIMNSVERVLPADSRIELINKLQEEPSKVRPDHITKKGFDFLTETLNMFYERLVLHNYLENNLPFPMWRHQPKNTFLSMVVFEDNASSTSATYTQKVLFFAEAIYYVKNKIENREAYEDWMRVVRNIISRGDVEKDGSRPDIVRSPQSFDGAINLINELANGCDDIYEYLNKRPNLKSQYAKEQIAEEIEKAQLICFDRSNREIIFLAEDNDLLRGKIGIIFYCIDYQFNPMNFDSNQFSLITKIINKYFGSESSINNDIRRAMMTIDVDGHYEFYSYWWSYWHIGNATKRRLFDRFREIEYFMNNENYREYFKKIVLLLQEKQPAQIALEFNPPEGFPNWKRRLIKETYLLDDYNKTNHIAIAEDNSHCYLLKSKRPREIEGNIRID